MYGRHTQGKCANCKADFIREVAYQTVCEPCWEAMGADDDAALAVPRCDWCKEEVAPPGGMHTDCMKEMYVADMMQDRR